MTVNIKSGAGTKPICPSGVSEERPCVPGIGQTQSPISRMNIRSNKLKWFAAFLAIAAIGAGYPAVQTYLESQSQIRSEEKANALLDRLAQDQHLNTILRLLKAGAVEEATQRLNYLVCGDIVNVHALLASTDDRTRAFAQQTFSRMAQCRPKPSPAAVADFHGQRYYEEVEAERIFAKAVAADRVVGGISTASR